MRIRMTLARSLGAMALAVVLAACGGGASDATDGGGDRPASTGEIRIVQPEPGAVVPADDVVVEVELTGATIAAEASTDIRPDEGHIHISVDGETITLLGGLREEVPGLEPGTHLLEVEFAASDHGPFEPPVIESVTFTVE
jgi:hypothetical protein